MTRRPLPGTVAEVDVLLAEYAASPEARRALWWNRVDQLLDRRLELTR